jgi:hypothetical protein
MENILRFEGMKLHKVASSIRRYRARFCNRGQIHLDQATHYYNRAVVDYSWRTGSCLLVSNE